MRNAGRDHQAATPLQPRPAGLGSFIIAALTAAFAAVWAVEAPNQPVVCGFFSVLAGQAACFLLGSYRYARKFD